jgi:hypothetical protein
MIRNHFIKIMMEEKKEKFRLEAVCQIYIGEPKTTDDHLCLKLYVMKGLDKCVRIRRAMYHRLLIENFKFSYFKDEDKISLILNGLKDPEYSVINLCKQYLA